MRGRKKISPGEKNVFFVSSDVDQMPVLKSAIDFFCHYSWMKLMERKASEKLSLEDCFITARKFVKGKKKTHFPSIIEWCCEDWMNQPPKMISSVDTGKIFLSATKLEISLRQISSSLRRDRNRGKRKKRDWCVWASKLDDKLNRIHLLSRGDVVQVEGWKETKRMERAWILI